MKSPMTALFITGLIGPLYLVPFLVAFFLANAFFNVSEFISALWLSLGSGVMFYSYVATFVYGIPAIFFLEKLNKLNLRNLIIVSSAPGIIITIFISMLAKALVLGTLFLVLPAIIVSAGCFITYKKERNSEKYHAE